MRSLRVLIVDDHRAFAEALAARLSLEPDLDVVGVAHEGTQAISLARAVHPDVVTLDLDLGGEDGVALAQQFATLASPPSVVFVSGVSDAAHTVRAVRAGALSWVTKDAAIADLVTAVRGAARGESHISPALLTVVLRDLVAGPEQDDSLLGSLTEREREVLGCLVGGLDRRAIAAALFLSPNTVRTHIQNLLTKLDVHTSLEAAAFARQHGVRPKAANALSGQETRQTPRVSD